VQTTGCSATRRPKTLGVSSSEQVNSVFCVFGGHILERNACDLKMSNKRLRGKTVHNEAREVLV
jgi:hypothetical protein